MPGCSAALLAGSPVACSGVFDSRGQPCAVPFLYKIFDMYIWTKSSHTYPVIRNKSMTQEELNMSKNQNQMNQMNESNKNSNKNSQKNCGRNSYESGKTTNSAGQNSKNCHRQSQDSRNSYGEE